MKIFNLALVAFTIVAISPTAYAKNGESREKITPVSDVYVPNGFDSGSDAFVVVNGLFPNSCYSLKAVTVNHVGPTLHEVTTTANVTEGLCLAVIIPFHREVQLGKLAVAKHTLHFLNGDGTYLERQLTIER